MTTKIFVVEHRDMIRAGLHSFAAGADVEIIGEAASGKEALQQVQEKKPDVVLIGMPLAEDSLTTLGRFRQKLAAVPVVVFGAEDALTFIARSMARGAAGFLRESCSREEFLATVRRAASGHAAWTDVQLSRFRGAPARPDDLQVPLTPRELQVLRQLSMGLPNREIAQMLGISNETVKEHVGSVLRKLAVSDRTKAAVWAIRHGLD